MPSSHKNLAPETLFAGFLARLEAGEKVTIADLCAEHPTDAEALCVNVDETAFELEFTVEGVG